MSGDWKEKSGRRDWAKEIMELVHAEGYEPSTLREVRHMLNVPPPLVSALQDAIATLLDEGKLKLGSRERIMAYRERKTRTERSAEHKAARVEKPSRRNPKVEVRATRMPREGEGWSAAYIGPPWKVVTNLFAKAHDLPGPFPKNVRELATSFGQPSAKDIEKRVDCRADDVCTIDPWNAHDHDDAVGVVELPRGGWRLDVHIADVSHYVTEGSALDKVAIKRAFTTYLPWTAVTMLPNNLAGDLCSLLEGKERLALTCRMEITTEGQIRSFKFFESVVKVRRFLAYEKAQELADDGDPALLLLKACSETLLARRKRENLLGFDLPEPKIVFDDKNEPIDAKPGERLASHRWIEEAMLAANQCCAHLLDEKNIPGLYRVHEAPESTSLEAISAWGETLGLQRWHSSQGDSTDDGTNVRPRMQEWLAKLLADERLPVPLQGRIIRSMKKARYSPDCRGHFALGWMHYAHYTSPIRRYPDLWTHRVIKAHIAGQGIPAQWPAQVRRLAMHVSTREDAVVKSERSGNKSCAAWILRERVGDLFEAVVTGVEAVGVFAQVQNPWAEGMMHVRRMQDDFYEYDEARMELRGRRTAKTFRIGDKIQVRLAQADPVQGWVDFEPPEAQNRGIPAPRTGREAPRPSGAAPVNPARSPSSSPAQAKSQASSGANLNGPARKPKTSAKGKRPRNRKG